MNGRTRGSHHKPIISFADVKNKPIDRTHFFKSKTRFIYSYFSKTLNELYNGIWSAFAFDHVDMNDLKRAMLPVASSGALILMGNYTTTRLSQYYHETEDYDFIYKFMLAFAILSYSALHCVTDKKIKQNPAYSAAVASEIMAVAYLYYSTYQATEFLVKDTLSDNYALIAGLGVSGLGVPGAMAYSAQKIQNGLVKKDYAKGAQRSDTAFISSGLTAIANTFFLAHYYLISEMTVSHIFQLTSIAHAILHDIHIKKFRDVPSFVIDRCPLITSEIQKQQMNIEHDYQHNTARHRVLRMTQNGPVFFTVPRYQLRYGDFVLCDAEMDLSSMPISGEVISLEDNSDKLHIFPSAVSKKISTNLIALTGENKWIIGKTGDSFSDHQAVDLHAVRDGKQTGVLVGSQLNVYGGQHFFVRIMPEKEHTTSQGYQKKPVISDIITQHKTKTVVSAVLLSILLGGMLSRSDVTLLPENALRLMFHVFQMMIPFSEVLLTKVVMNRLMKKINAHLDQEPMDVKSILRNVDFCNAVSGYYEKEFPAGVAFGTDKTGTLTTSDMNVVGIWTTGQNNSTITQAELFAWIFTHQEKEFEPEEFSMKEHFAKELEDPDFLTIETRGSNHFIKKIKTRDASVEAETWHLGLHRPAGGRFTLVDREGTYYLAFCGVPNEAFQSTPLFVDYAKMGVRTGVLSRDWCIAHRSIAPELFLQLKNGFEQNDEKFIQAFFLNSDILFLFHHDYTCQINNPVKKDAEKLIDRLLEKEIEPVILTGDTPNACININDILCPANAGKARVVKKDTLSLLDVASFNRQMTLIFVGINAENLALYKRILARQPKERPVIIFSEMSTEGKGMLVSFLKENGFFVAFNGDGTNDTRAMAEAHVVYAHKTSKGTYAPGVEQYADLNDRQLQKMFQSDKSFYELFDMHQSQSAYYERFAETANSIEKSVTVLKIKGGFKMSFELLKSMGWSVIDMAYFHPANMLFDVIYFAMASREIIESADRPMDNKHLGASDFPLKLQMATLAFAALQAFATFALTGESTNIYCMVLMLAAVPVILKSLFSAFGQVQEEHSMNKLAEEKNSAGCGHRLFDYPVKLSENQDAEPPMLRCRTAPMPRTGKSELTI